MKELLVKLLSESDDNMLEMLFDCLVLDEKHQKIAPARNRYTISSNGGILSIPEESNTFSVFENAPVFLDFVKVYFSFLIFV